MKFRLLLLIFTLASSLNFSQVLYWQELRIFRFVYDLEVAFDQAIFISQQGDANHQGGLIRSTDFGNTWSVMTNFPTGYYPHELSFDTADSVLYCFSEYSGKVAKSFDLGNSWIIKNTGIWVRNSTIGSSGIIYCCDEDSNFVYSENQGDNWAYFKFPGAKVSDIGVNSNGVLFAATHNLGLHKTSDFGTTWEQLYSGSVRSLDIDELDNIYISTFSGVLVSENGGSDWTNANYPQSSPNLIEVDSSGKIFVADWWEGLYSMDNSSWSLVGLQMVKNLVINQSSKILAVSRDFEGTERLFLYDPEAIPDTLGNFVPLKVGNKWERFYSYSNGMDPIYDYSIKISSVYADTTIQNQKYYKVSGLSDSWLKYDDSLNILFTFDNSKDFVFIDFNKLPGETYYRYYNSNDSSLVEAIGSTENILGQSVKCKGFKRQGYFSTSSYLFGENFGFYKKIFHSSDIGSSSSLKTIQAILINENNDTTYFPHNYWPQFLIEPVTTLDSLKFHLDFQVDHHYTRFYHHSFFQDSGVNYIDSVMMEFFYHKDGQSTMLDTVFATNSPLTTDYSIQFNLDSAYLNSGYDLKYRLTATEIGILPKSTTVPDTGWYTCIYDNTVSAEDELDNLPQEFSLSQNYPNPFNPTTNIKFFIPNVETLPAAAGKHAPSLQTRLVIYDILGKEVAILLNEQKQPGTYEVGFDAGNLPSGVYFYRLTAGEFSATNKMMLLK